MASTPKLGPVAVRGLSIEMTTPAERSSRLGTAPLIGVTVVELDGGRGMTVAGRAIAAGGRMSVALNAARDKPGLGSGPSMVQGSGAGENPAPDVGAPLGLFVSEQQQQQQQ